MMKVAVSRFIEHFETDENIPGVFLGRHDPEPTTGKKKGKKSPGYREVSVRIWHTGSTSHFCCFTLSLDKDWS